MVTLDTALEMGVNIVSTIVILYAIYKLGAKIMADLSALTSQVEQTTTVEQSAIVLLQGLSSQLAAAGTDPQKLEALRAALGNSAAALAAAVAANTPAAPAAPAAPAPAPTTPST